jgi:4a-hydroxytetrahydrobiopterin dehydratase
MKTRKTIVWRELDDGLTADLVFSDFASAFRFMTEVAEVAERQNHHPEWSNVYNRVSIRLTTHDAGNRITHKDRELAEAISGLPTTELLVDG